MFKFYTPVMNKILGLIKSKTYKYKIFYGQTLSPFKCRYFTHIPYPLNLKLMQKAVKYFRGEKDFTSFTSDEPNKRRKREAGADMGTPGSASHPDLLAADGLPCHQQHGLSRDEY